MTGAEALEIKKAAQKPEQLLTSLYTEIISEQEILLSCLYVRSLP
jgi:hypothetical protein